MPNEIKTISDVECWMPVEGFPLFEVSNLGGIKRSGSVINPHINSSGYYAINLSNARMKRSYLVHRIVAKAFIPNPDLLPEINHKDFDKTNNSVSNLEWITHTDNVKHFFESGRKRTRTVVSNKPKDLKKEVTLENVHTGEIEVSGTVKDAASIISVSPAALHCAFRKGRLVSRKYRVTIKDLSTGQDYVIKPYAESHKIRTKRA